MHILHRLNAHIIVTEPTCGEGTSKFKGKKEIVIHFGGKHGKIFTSEDVLYTPWMKRNLISGRFIDQTGHTGVIENSSYTVYIEKGQFRWQAKLSKEILYTLTGTIVINEREANNLELHSFKNGTED